MAKEEEAHTTTTLSNTQVWMTDKNKKRKVNMRFILNQQYLNKTRIERCRKIHFEPTTITTIQDQEEGNEKEV